VVAVARVLEVEAAVPAVVVAAVRVEADKVAEVARVVVEAAAIASSFLWSGAPNSGAPFFF